MDPRTRLLIDAPPGRTILRLSGPTLLVMVVQSAVGVMETYFVGRLGEDALAGMALVFPAFMLLQMVSAGAIGGAILSAVARALGAGRREQVDEVVWTSLVVTIVLAMLVGAAMIRFGEPLYRAMGGSGASLAAALAYSDLVFGGALLVWLFNTFAAILRGSGNMIVPAVVITVGALLLIPISPLLIFGFGPVPRFGITGGAIAILVYYAIGSVVMAAWIWSGRGVVRPSRRPRPAWAPMIDILRIGLTSALTSLSTNLTVAVTIGLVGSADPASIAGYGTAVRLEYLLVPLGFGIGAPTAAMVGTAIGAGRPERALRVAVIGAALAGVVTEAIGLAAASVPSTWLGLFSDDPAVVAAGAGYLRVVGPAFGFYGIGFVFYFACQGAGRMTLPFLASLSRVVIVALLGPMAIARFGPAGLWSLIAGAMVLYCGLNAAGLKALARRYRGASPTTR